jgi:hypothetical protein
MGCPADFFHADVCAARLQNMQPINETSQLQDSVLQQAQVTILLQRFLGP